MTRPNAYVVVMCATLMLAVLPAAGSTERAEYPGHRAAPRQLRRWAPARMTFFVTSVGIGKGGDLGGLAGADAHCQALAAAVGAGARTWHAYLSTQARPGRARRQRT